MTTASTFPEFAALLRQFMAQWQAAPALPGDLAAASSEERFNALALDLFALQHRYNATYRRLCDASGVSPGTVLGWEAIPTVPTSRNRPANGACTLIVVASATA